MGPETSLYPGRVTRDRLPLLSSSQENGVLEMAKDLVPDCHAELGKAGDAVPLHCISASIKSLCSIYLQIT